MNPELDKKLVETYPILYAQRHKPMNVTCMCWGFDVGDGWYKLIDELSQQLEWLNNTGAVTIEAVQVKEKFGTLRFYTNIIPKQDDFPAYLVWNLTDYAEWKSGYVCEQCGNPGQRRDGGWIRTLCDECEQRRRHHETD